MNFSLMLCLFFILTACGVKGDPSTPQGTSLPSLLDNYEDIKTDVPLNDTKKFKR